MAHSTHWLSATLLGIAVTVATPVSAELTSRSTTHANGLSILVNDAYATNTANTNRSTGRIASGFPVSNSARGTRANKLSSIFGRGKEESQRYFVKLFADERTKMEQRLTDANFDINDLGVAKAMCMTVLWELSSGVTLTEAQSTSVMKQLVRRYTNQADRFNKLSEQELAVAHDWAMATPVAFASVIALFESLDKTDAVTTFRTSIGKLFEETYSTPHTTIYVTDRGTFGYTDSATVAPARDNTSSNNAGSPMLVFEGADEAKANEPTTHADNGFNMD